MDGILKTACADTIKNSSFKNYKSISIKLFNIINKNDYNENMNEEELMIGFGKIINKFDTLKEYLDSDVNNFKITTKKNYINNLLNVILKIKDIDNYCIKKKKKLDELKKDIKDYWIFLRMLVNDNKKKKLTTNEIEKNDSECSEEENEIPITEEAPIIKKEPIEELDELVLKYTNQNYIANCIFKLNCEINTLELEDKLMKQEIENISKKQKMIQERISELKETKKEEKNALIKYT